MPCRAANDSKLLSDLLKSSPELVGDSVLAKFGCSDGSLPFLFKILSIRKALSIQAHSDKALAERLPKERSDLCKGVVIDGFTAQSIADRR